MIFSLLCIVGAQASNYLLSSLQVFQPERAIIDGLGPSTRSLSIQSPPSFAAEEIKSPVKLKLSLDLKDRLMVESEGTAGIFVVRGKVLICPQASPEEGEHNALQYASTARRPLPLQPGDFILALTAHDENVPELTINDMRNLLEGDIERNYVKRSRRLAEYLQNHNASFVTALVRDPAKDHVNTSYSIINFYGQVDLNANREADKVTLRNHRSGRPSDARLGSRHSLASETLVEHLEMIVGKQHEEVKRRDELLKPLDPAEISTFHTEFYTSPTGHRHQNLAITTATNSLRDSSEGVRRRHRPADKHVFAQMVAKEVKPKKTKEETVEEEETDDNADQEVKLPKKPKEKEPSLSASHRKVPSLSTSHRKVPSLSVSHPKVPRLSVSHPTVNKEQEPTQQDPIVSILKPPESPLRRSNQPLSPRAPVNRELVQQGRSQSQPNPNPLNTPVIVHYVFEQQPAMFIPIYRTRMRRRTVAPHPIGGYYYI